MRSRKPAVRRRPIARATLAALATATITGSALLAHKPITSKYTYHADVYPIFLQRCSSCHAPDGVAPMSLLTYENAYPWAQSIKEEVVSLGMPPWQPEDGFGAFKHGGSLSAKELDIVVEWSNGGTPEGTPETRPELPGPAAEWSLGTPSLTLDMPEPFMLDADAMQATRTFVIPSGLDTDRWVKAVDFRPGSPAILRSAMIYVDTTGQASAQDEADPAPGFAAEDESAFPTDHLLAAWVPGHTGIEIAGRAAYRLPAGADLVLSVRYKKTWTYEGIAVEDQSAIGLYFTDNRMVAPIETLILAPPAEGDAGRGPRIVFYQTIERDLEVLGMVPEIAGEPAFVQVEAVHADGSREPVIRLARPRPEWRTRYWLASPLRLPQGTQLEVAVVFDSTGWDSVPPIRFRLDVVPATSDRASALR